MNLPSASDGQLAPRSLGLKVVWPTLLTAATKKREGTREKKWIATESNNYTQMAADVHHDN